jgi:glutamate-ammonia-ligase adenylyltransferase
LSDFKDQGAAHRSRDRIASSAGEHVAEFVLGAAAATSRPDQAMVNVERWLGAGNATTSGESLVAVPELGRLFILLLGASHELGDVLVQNPEMAYFILDPGLLQEQPDAQRLDTQIEALLAESTSHSHSLDRLRFLKQAWHVRIAAADLAGVWSEPDVWLALSTVAESIVRGTQKVVWLDVCRQRRHEGPCPVSIVAMGKLGGRELNFSSDIDLVYLLLDGASVEEEKLATRFAEAMNRALADRMGRGSLYRVDLRLRPFGGRGPLVPPMESVEDYYGRYAEAWEHLAMVRSRVITGGLADRWSALRDKTCFQASRGEWFVQELVAMRARIEESHTEDDIKRGSGGIRDIEFLTQILQLLYGKAHPELKGFSTLESLAILGDKGILTPQAVDSLTRAYSALRQIEHRLQLLGNLQTHTVPTDLDERAELSLRAGYPSVDAFDTALALHRTNARDWYRTVLSPNDDATPSRDRVVANAGAAGTIIGQWIDSIPESAAFYESIAENASSLERLKAIAEIAPVLVPQLRQHVTITEQLMSGEILEEPSSQPVTNIENPVLAARQVRRSWLRAVVRWVLVQDSDFGQAVAAVYDEVVRSLLAGSGLRAVALGSYGAREMHLFSDLDVVFWKDGELAHEADEKAAQAILANVQSLRRAGAQIELDLRLRPEGKKGRLVHTEATLRAYEESKMEPWERLALGRSRAEGGLPIPIALAAFGHPLDSSTLQQLTGVKARVEAERVPVQYRRRHIKLGRGGQDDVLWTVQLLWWRHADQVDKDKVAVKDRLSELQRIGAINAVEREEIVDAWSFYTKLRLHLGLLGLNDDVLPENPDKLARLGQVSELGRENEVLKGYEAHAKVVRGHFTSVVERLGG